jgi:hypothetical protein
VRLILEERQRIGWAPRTNSTDGAPSLYVWSRAWYSRKCAVLLVQCRPYLNDDDEPPWLPEDGDLLEQLSSGSRQFAAIRRAIQFIDHEVLVARGVLAGRCPGCFAPGFPDRIVIDVSEEPES